MVSNLLFNKWIFGVLEERQRGFNEGAFPRTFRKGVCFEVKGVVDGGSEVFVVFDNWDAVYG